MVKLEKILELRPEDIKTAKALRQKSLDDAIVLEKGPSRNDMLYYSLWTGEGYEVGVGKPGKETVRKIPNVNDMWPYIRKGEVFEEKSATFDHIFRELEHLSTYSPYALELLGCLLARSAYMLDHDVVDGKVRYVPPAEVVKEIAKHIPKMFNVPLNVFLQYLEAIALNEDVKYQRRLNTEGKPYGKNAGRPNNLLTCAHLIAVLLGKADMISFATGFAKQRGVSALPTKQLSTCFPMLAVDKTEAKTIEKELLS